MLRSIYVDTNVFDPRMVEQLVHDLGAEHVLMGTDYPFDMSTVDPLGFLAEAALTDADRDLVLGGKRPGCSTSRGRTMSATAASLIAVRRRPFCARSGRTAGARKHHGAARLVEADLRGRTGHGLIRLRRSRPDPCGRGQRGARHQGHARDTRDGAGRRRQRARTGGDDAGSRDGDRQGADTGLAWVGTVHSNHAGAAGLYAQMAADAGLVGIYLAVANANGMPPWGGTNPLLGTNPLAIAIPTNGTPFVLDIATTSGVPRHHQGGCARGPAMPEGWVVDPDGRPITDPARADEGFLVPMGGYKGSGLTIAIGLLAGVLNGAAFGADVVDHRRDEVTPTNTGQAILVLRADLFRPHDEVLADVTSHLGALRDSGSPTADRCGSPVTRPPGQQPRTKARHPGARRPRHRAARACTELDVESPFTEAEAP